MFLRYVKLFFSLKFQIKCLHAFPAQERSRARIEEKEKRFGAAVDANAQVNQVLVRFKGIFSELLPETKRKSVA